MSRRRHARLTSRSRLVAAITLLLSRRSRLSAEGREATDGGSPRFDATNALPLLERRAPRGHYFAGRSVEMPAMKLTVRLKSNSGPRALMIRCSPLVEHQGDAARIASRNCGYPNPANRPLTLSHMHEMAWVRIYTDKDRPVHINQ
jgi:hypothetical protein